MLLGALTTGHTIGLGVVAAIFVAFALASSFLGPRWKPDFPGKSGMKLFIVLSFVMFFAMLAAVAVFAAEKTEQVAKVQAVAAGTAVPVAENEFHVILASKKLPPGSYSFVVTNRGKIQHDLAVQGGKVNVKTPLINPGATAKVTATLGPGTYTLYCTVPGHKAAGMVAKLTVG